MPTWMVKALGVGPGVTISVVVVALMLAAAPPPAAAVAALVATGVAVAAALSTCEELAATLLLGTRRIRPAEREDLAVVLTQLCRVGLGPPLVQVRVKRSRIIGAVGVGRHTVVVSTGLIRAVALGELPSRQAAALIAHSAVLVREGLTRADLIIGCVSMPWRVVRAAVRVVSGPLRRLPLAQVAWRLRAVVVVVAVEQALQLGQVGFGVAIAAIGALSYGVPTWETTWHDLLLRSGDDGVARAGLGGGPDPLPRACPEADATKARLGTRVATDRQRPGWGLVTR